jgi:HD-GYP domain-containing protein (c-di-GMP phosphodiesterase class II)
LNESLRGTQFAVFRSAMSQDAFTVQLTPPQAAEIYHPAPLATLRPNTGAMFELYLALPGRPLPRYILYKGAGIEFTDKKRRELMDNGVSTLYVTDAEAGKYFDYVDNAMGQMLTSDTIPPQEKSQILYETTCSLVKSTFDKPNSPLLMTTNKKMVSHTVQAIAADPAMLRTMVSLFAYDYSLYSHSVHVAVLGTGILLETGIGIAKDIPETALGFLLHDIGKSRVSPEILRKPTTLTPWEHKQMERHPDLGVNLMQQHSGISAAALDIIRGHHERLDGTGYPRHLAQRAITPEVRICAVADVFDAFTSHRVYRPAMTGVEAMRTILTTMSHELDDEIVHVLIHRLGPNAKRPV